MRSTTTGLALLLAALVLPLAAGPVKAQSGLLDIGKSILGIEDEKPEIDYRPRPPLVIPPKKDLPPPAAPAPPAAEPVTSAPTASTSSAPTPLMAPPPPSLRLTPRSCGTGERHFQSTRHQ